MSVNQLENICIEVRKPHSKPFVVSTWYRPPDSLTEIFTHFKSLVGRLDSQNVDPYLMGDLNCNLAHTNLTILGPLLFLIFINDSPNCLLSSQPRMYADDTHLTFSSNDISAINEVLNRDLDSVNNWLVSKKLTLNTTKTEFIVISSRQRLNTFSRPPHLTFGGVPVNRVCTAKSLGVYIDENLSWRSHGENLAKRGIALLNKSDHSSLLKLRSLFSMP